MVGAFKNAGRRWLPKGKPAEVSVHDFPHLGEGKAIRYGTYAIARDKAAVTVGVIHDTAEFAVESIRQRAWKLHLQARSDETGLAITVCHEPSGTSKWNKIEHRLVFFISLNGRGKPLLNFETIVNLIGGTHTRSGLKVKAVLATNPYETGVKTPDEEIDKLRLERQKIHPNWNDTLRPRTVMP
jgi:hypothetical protein